jgi:hemoglobin
MAEASLYERLGGAFAIAAVIDHFSDAVVRNPIAGQESENAELREWSTHDLDRLPGLKFMRTLWVCDIAGGPQHYAATKPGSTPLGLEEAHRELKISPAIFDEVRGGTWAIARLLQGARAGARGGFGCVRGTQGRGD